MEDMLYERMKVTGAKRFKFRTEIRDAEHRNGQAMVSARKDIREDTVQLRQKKKLIIIFGRNEN